MNLTATGTPEAILRMLFDEEPADVAVKECRSYITHCAVILTEPWAPKYPNAAQALKLYQDALPRLEARLAAEEAEESAAEARRAAEAAEEEARRCAEGMWMKWLRAFRAAPPADFRCAKHGRDAKRCDCRPACVACGQPCVAREPEPRCAKHQWGASQGPLRLED